MPAIDRSLVLLPGSQTIRSTAFSDTEFIIVNTKIMIFMQNSSLLNTKCWPWASAALHSCRSSSSQSAGAACKTATRSIILLLQISIIVYYTIRSVLYLSLQRQPFHIRWHAPQWCRQMRSSLPSHHHFKFKFHDLKSKNHRLSCKHHHFECSNAYLDRRQSRLLCPHGSWEDINYTRNVWLFLFHI